MARGEGVVTLESGKAKPKKVLSHLEVHPKMGGGHTVRHIYTHPMHEPKEVHFKQNEGHKAMAHIARHAGLPGYSNRKESETEDEMHETDRELVARE